MWRNQGLMVVAPALVVVGLLAAIQGAEAQSGGGILVNIRAGGQAAKGEVVILTSAVEPVEVAKGKTGQPISVPAGRYDVNVTCTEMIDHPTQSLRDVNVTGTTVERELTFPAGTITLHVKRGGRNMKKAVLTLVKGGNELPGKARSGQAFKISPGTYEAQIQVGKKSKHTITGIQAYDGATRHIPVDL